MNSLNTRDPKFVAFWTRCIRESSNWSQEALAASSGLDVRTIQRIEAGKHVSTTTRRALARGLGYDNPDVFDDPTLIKCVQALFDSLQKAADDETKKQFPDHIRLIVTKATSGQSLARLAYESNGYLFHADDGLSSQAKETAASLFDYLHDLGDIGDDISFSDRLVFSRELDDTLNELEQLGCACYIASRSTKIVGSNWEDKMPMPFTIGYLTVVPAETILTEMMVPRGLS